MPHGYHAIFNTRFEFDHSNLRNTYAVYGHTFKGNPGEEWVDRPFYIGVTRLITLFNPTDCGNNQMWREAVLDTGLPYATLLIGIFESKADAWQYRVQRIKDLDPPCNRKIGGKPRHGIGVFCVETNEYWHSAYAAAKALGFTSGTLYNHLNGRVGYHAIAGRHYKRGLPPTITGRVSTPERQREVAAMATQAAYGDATYHTLPLALMSQQEIADLAASGMTKMQIKIHYGPNAKWADYRDSGIAELQSYHAKFMASVQATGCDQEGNRVEIRTVPIDTPQGTE